jgi:hypothetical protein
MDASILAIIANFPAWRGDTYRLAALIMEAQKSVIRETLIQAGFLEAAEVI